jgi:hypothetical protein
MIRGYVAINGMKIGRRNIILSSEKTYPTVILSTKIPHGLIWDATNCLTLIRTYMSLREIEIEI